MRKVSIITLVFLSIVALILRFGANPLIKTLGLEPRAGLRVESNKKAKVLVNGSEVGNTPFQNESMTEGEYLVSLKPDEEATSSVQVSWQGYVKLNGGTLTVVNRELADTQSASSGEVINLEKGNGVTVVSIPTSAVVSMDGKEIGRTPVKLNGVLSGEHQFLISKDNFLKRSIKASLVEGYNLNLSVDLAIAEVDLSKVPTIPTTQTAQVVVRATPTGFLRVRSEANLNSQEVGRVNPGETLVLLEELPNWDRVRLPDGQEGYVSSSYVEKKTQ